MSDDETKPPEPGSRKPRGRDEVRSALIEAANELFGMKGPDAVSVRDVAQQAQVNHALLHRHFGSKEQLLRDVMAEHAASFLDSSSKSESVGDALSRMFDLMATFPAFPRIVAHLLLAGHRPEEFVAQNGGLAHLVDLMRPETGRPLDDARLAAAAGAAFSMGWMLFEPFVLYGAGYKGDTETARVSVRRKIEEMIASRMNNGVVKGCCQEGVAAPAGC